jgi:hypothetical protein
MSRRKNSGCPAVDPRPPIDEVNYKIGSADLSFKISKKAGSLKHRDGTDASGEGIQIVQFNSLRRLLELVE